MKKPAVIHTDSFFSVTFIDEGRSFVILSDDERFEKCLELFSREDYEGLRNFLNPDYRVEEFSNGDLKIDIEEGSITYKDSEVHNVIVGRVFDCIKGKMPYKHLLAFLNNVLECDSSTVLNELYLFLESNESMPITDDGAFLAYRVVNSEYLSKHANPDGTHNRNFVGDIVEMGRNQVNPDRNKTCSYGLHFCSYNYINAYGYGNSDRVMIVKVFPQDVIAIPNDYNNAKGRCCRYEVVGEVEGYDGGSEQFKSNAEQSIETLAYDYEVEDYDEDFEEDEPGYDVDDIDFDNIGDLDSDRIKYDCGSFDNAIKEVTLNVLNESERMVKRILERQTFNGQVTTARRASKSTSPYIPCEKVIDIAESLGYSIEESETLSLTTIQK